MPETVMSLFAIGSILSGTAAFIALLYAKESKHELALQKQRHREAIAHKDKKIAELRTNHAALQANYTHLETLYNNLKAGKENACDAVGM